MGKILSIIYRSLATTQLRLALETEEERRARIDWIKIGFFLIQGMTPLTLAVMGTIFLVWNLATGLYM